MENFNSAYALLNLLYGIEISPEDFEELGLIAWNKIGNKLTKLYRYITNIDCETLSVELPCNCDLIEAVTYCYEDWQYTTNDTMNGDYSSHFTENYIEGRKEYNNPFYAGGKFVKYERVGNTLYFDKNYGTIKILYKGIILDDEGLPFINEKEKDAIACYVALADKFKLGLRTHNLAILLESLLLEQRWKTLCDAARVPMYINQNEMNEILDAKSSWNRKMFNKSWKFVK